MLGKAKDSARFQPAPSIGSWRRQKGIPLDIVQRRLGHARIETMAIYASAIGDDERNLARRAWRSLELAIPERYRCNE